MQSRIEGIFQKTKSFLKSTFQCPPLKSLFCKCSNSTLIILNIEKQVGDTLFLQKNFAKQKTLQSKVAGKRRQAFNQRFLKYYTVALLSAIQCLS